MAPVFLLISLHYDNEVHLDMFMLPTGLTQVKEIINYYINIYYYIITI